jgi:DNA-directed RNA polymerase subunit RPC12/RpoP
MPENEYRDVTKCAVCGRLLQEDFENGCLRCPTCGIEVSLAEAMEGVQRMIDVLGRLLYTFREELAGRA